MANLTGEVDSYKCMGFDVMLNFYDNVIFGLDNGYTIVRCKN